MDYERLLEEERRERERQAREAWEEIDSPNPAEPMDAMGDCEVDGEYEF